MNYAGIFSATTQLVTYELGADDFDRLLLHVQRKIENKREWVILKNRDTSLSLTPADYNNGSLTAKSLPSEVLESLEFLADRPVVLIDEAGNEFPVEQIPLEARQSYFNVFGKYFIDYYNGAIYFCGQANKTYTVGLNYKRVPPAIASGQDWKFPAKFHSLLPYGIAIIHKNGIDYDFINALQAAKGQGSEYAEVWEDMVLWDAKMQADSLKGLDRYTGGERPFISGTINTN